MLISKEVYPRDLVDVADVKYVTLAGGKSGTSTMSRMVNENLGTCIHTHGQLEFGKVHVPPGSDYSLPDLYRDIEQSQGEVNILSVFREPLTKIISNCFQFGRLDRSHDKHQEFRRLLAEGELSYLTECPHEDVNNFGDIDIYRETFDHERGFSAYTKDNVTVYFFLFSHISNWSKQLTEIFDKPVVQSSANLTGHPGYREFLSRLRVRKSDLQDLYQVSEKDLAYFFQVKNLDGYCEYVNALFYRKYGNIKLVG